MTSAPVVGVLMGSSSDWDTLKHAVEILAEFGVPYETKVVSAHRMPDDMFAYAEAAAGRGLRAIIAGAGGAAHLPGMLAAKTVVPVLGVPVASRHLQGVDSLHSIVQMPRGVPVATFAIGSGGAANAALFVVAMLGGEDSALRARLEAWRAAQTDAARRAGRIRVEHRRFVSHGLRRMHEHAPELAAADDTQRRAGKKRSDAHDNSPRRRSGTLDA